MSKKEKKTDPKRSESAKKAAETRKKNALEKKKRMEQLSSFEEDLMWMSYRYCIGRHTIAAHQHAGNLASFGYRRLNENRMEFMSEDINKEIHDRLHWNNFVDFGWYGNIPKEFFKPLDVLYTILNKENVNSYATLKKIKNIVIEWDRDKSDYDYSIYYFNENDKNKDYGRNFTDDIQDLEVWQQLANLFDKRTHKKCKLIDGTIVEYYEFWKCENYGGALKYRKIKTPIEENSVHFYPITVISEEYIKEDNLEI